MMIVMRNDATEEQIQLAVARVETLGMHGHLVRGTERTVIGWLGMGGGLNRRSFQCWSGSTILCQSRGLINWPPANFLLKIRPSPWTV